MCQVLSEMIYGSFGNKSVNKIRHYVLDILLVLLRDYDRVQDSYEEQ